MKQGKESASFFEKKERAARRGPKKLLRVRFGASHRWVTPGAKSARRLTHPTAERMGCGQKFFAARGGRPAFFSKKRVLS
jgi:hypothetical protein